jgi:alkanesulfonate monooxygenase SsuD/methylene tetrahydromethanopterin reductase-like flavin-dependent oxidoreductase (luciferase family)
MSDDAVTVDALLDEMVIYGSPKTVADKIMAFREKVGPFGKLMLATTDWGGNRAFEESSMTLLGTQVAPLLDRAVPKGAAA